MGRALLLDFGGSESLCNFAGRYRDQGTYLPGNAGDPSALHSLVVRAEGFVALAGDRPSNCAGAARALPQIHDKANPLADPSV